VCAIFKKGSTIKRVCNLEKGVNNKADPHSKFLWDAGRRIGWSRVLSLGRSFVDLVFFAGGGHRETVH
jgi:hypothetical protein